MSDDVLTTMHDIVEELAGCLRQHCRAGFDFLSESEAAAIASELESLSQRFSTGLSVRLPESASTLADIECELHDCSRCRLGQTRTNLVFGRGFPKAQLMLIGEAPGQEEDESGEPFVGKAGQLLTRIIQAINLKRDEVYITNIVKCRPPRNRDPEKEEIQACFPFLRKQLEIIQPKVICALGRISAHTLLNTRQPISQLRGNVYQCGTSRIVPTYHPASLLRNPQWKRDVWHDIQLVAKLLKEPSA